MKFCPYCGYAAQKTCAHCGTIQSASYAFCSECGNNLGTDMTPALDSFIPAVKSSHTGTVSYFGTREEEDLRKHATVLFADLKSSTNMVEGLDPEEAKNLLLPIVDAMREAIISYDGTIIKTAGDGIVAVFGAPHSMEDHALRACLAALSMHENVAKINSELKIRVGLNSGEVYLELLGDKIRKEYDITGQTVNLAARMEQTAKPGKIQITKYTLSLVETNVQVTPIGAVDIKGFSQPIDVFELDAVIENKLLAETKERPTFLPFVGREKEINLLSQLAEDAKVGHGNAAGIVAEAGQGRSRLIYELLRKENIADKFNVLMTSCYSHTNNVPYAPIRIVLQQLTGISIKETPENAFEKVKTFLFDINVPFAIQAALVLLGVPHVDTEWDKLEVQIKRKYQIETIIAILRFEAEKKPLLFIMEDSNWMDSETEAFLDAFISEITQSRIFMILTSRPEFVDHWVNRREYTQIKLSSLLPKDEAIALNTLLGDHPSLQEIKTQLLQNSAGNPFFLEEMIKSLIRDKILIGTENHYQLSEKALAGKLQLPESIFAVIQAQLDNLSSLERKIIRMASVIGERFTYRMLTKIMDNESSQNIQQALRTLTANQIIYETRIYPEPESAFKHALIHEVAYNSLLKSLRKVMHIKILTVLETLPVEEQDLQLQAYHAYQGESWEKAFKYSYEAGYAMFFVLSANKAASALYQKALNASEHIQKSDEVFEKCLAMHMFLITIYRRLSRLQDEGKHITDLEKLLQSTKDRKYQSLKVLLTAMIGSYNLSLGEMQKAKHFYEKALHDSLQCDDKMMIPLIESYSSLYYLYTAQYKTLYANTDKALGLFPGLNYHHKLFPLSMGHFANFIKWWGHAYTGDYHPKENLEKQVNSFLASMHTGQPNIDVYYILLPIGLMYFYHDDFEKAIQYLSRALTIASEIEIHGYMPVISAALGCAYLRLGNKDDGKKFTHQAMSLCDTLESYSSKTMAFDLITEALLLIGDYQEAKQYGQHALEIVSQLELSGLEAILLRLNAEIDLHLPSPDYPVIKQQLQLALQKGEKAGMVLHNGRCHLVFAQMYKLMGDTPSYEREMQVAQQCFDELGIPS